MQHPDLKEMGIASIGHRMTILKAVYEVKMKQNIPLDPDHYIPPCRFSLAMSAASTDHTLQP